MDNIKLYSYFERCSVKELQRTKQLLDQLIKDKTPGERIFVSNLNVDDYVDYKQDFISEAENIALNETLRSHRKFKKDNTLSNFTKSLWLSRTSEPYEWKSRKTGSVIHNKAEPITDFPAIDAMLDRVNAELGSDLNSCLIQYYPDNTSGIRVHDDFEHVMDNNQPIAVVSLGAKRTVEFFHNYQTTSETPAKSIGVQSNSLYVMKSKCQEYYRHRVPSAKEPTTDRFSLSFRRIVSPEAAPVLAETGTCTSPVKSQINYFEQLQQNPLNQPAFSVVSPTDRPRAGEELSPPNEVITHQSPRIQSNITNHHPMAERSPCFWEHLQHVGLNLIFCQMATQKLLMYHIVEHVFKIGNLVSQYPILVR